MHFFQSLLLAKGKKVIMDGMDYLERREEGERLRGKANLVIKKTLKNKQISVFHPSSASVQLRHLGHEHL